MDDLHFARINDQATITVAAEYMVDGDIYHLSGRIDDRLISVENVSAEGDVWQAARIMMSDLMVEVEQLST